MRVIIPTFLLLFSLSQFISAQENKETITVVGDSLVGRRVDGQNIREVIGNVVMTQGDVRITCDKAIQYLSLNEAHLIGNVEIFQDSLTIITDEGFYLGDEKIAYSYKKVFLDDGNIKLTASEGYYYTSEKKANFVGEVNLIDSANTLTSDRLFYFKEENKIDAAGNVYIYESVSENTAHRLVYLKDKGSTNAFGNVQLEDLKNNIKMMGDFLIDRKEENYSKITGNPLFVQIDTAENGKIDTLAISSYVMEQTKDSVKKFIATGSVKIIRGDFSSINDKSIFFTDEDRILTVRETVESRPPILWFKNSQLAGDTVNIFLEDNRLKWIDVKVDASIISDNEDAEFRFDQISGDNIKLYFGDNNILRTEVDGSVLSIYYIAEGDEPSGLIKSSAQSAVIYFEDSAVERVKLYGSPDSEYHPENMIVGKEKDFTLPTFIIYEGRPDKESILGKRKFKN